jgi:hypothetical protein
MRKRHRGFKHALSSKDRLIEFAKAARSTAQCLPAGPERDDLIKRARVAETTAHLDEWVNSPGLRPPE